MMTKLMIVPTYFKDDEVHVITGNISKQPFLQKKPGKQRIKY